MSLVRNKDEHERDLVYIWEEIIKCTTLKARVWDKTGCVCENGTQILKKHDWRVFNLSHFRLIDY